jgi:hypothetical protein
MTTSANWRISLGYPDSRYKLKVWDEMKHKIRTIFLYLIHHCRILLPWTCEGCLKTLTVFIGLSRLGAAKWKSEPTNVE